MRTTLLFLLVCSLTIVRAEDLPRRLSDIRSSAEHLADPLPADVVTALHSAPEITVLSLNPSIDLQKDDPDHFRTWHVLGQTTVADAATRKKIATTIEESAKRAYGNAFKCFIPHHGFRFASGDHTYELVVCFMCQRVHIYTSGLPDRFARVTDGDAVVDAILTAAKVPLGQRFK